MIGLRKLKLHTKFEVARFSLCNGDDAFAVKHNAEIKIVRHSLGQNIGGKVLFWGAVINELILTKLRGTYFLCVYNYELHSDIIVGRDWRWRKEFNRRCLVHRLMISNDRTTITLLSNSRRSLENIEIRTDSSDLRILRIPWCPWKIYNLSCNWR